MKRVVTGLKKGVAECIGVETGCNRGVAWGKGGITVACNRRGCYIEVKG